MARLLRSIRSLCRIEFGLKRLGVELEQKLALLYDIAFLIGDLVEKARHPRDDIDLL